MQLDHLFICFDDASAAEQALGAFGLYFGLRSFHPGQGTANSCAFFDNAYLELLWPHDAQELQSAAVRPLALFERLHWRQTGASPFGVAFRGGGIGEAVKTWEYDAPFLPPGVGLPIVTPQGTPSEPLIFLIPPSLPIGLAPPAEHRGKRRTITGITLSGPGVSPSSLRVPQPENLRTFALGNDPEHLLELEWNNQSAGESRDFRPTLPLVVRW